MDTKTEKMDSNKESDTLGNSLKEDETIYIKKETEEENISVEPDQDFYNIDGTIDYHSSGSTEEEYNKQGCTLNGYINQLLSGMYSFDISSQAVKH